MLGCNAKRGPHKKMKWRSREGSFQAALLVDSYRDFRSDAESEIDVKILNKCYSYTPSWLHALDCSKYFIF